MRSGVAIMLTRIKLELPAIRQAILELDDEKLTADDLKAIGKQLPSSEEVSLFLRAQSIWLTLLYRSRG